MSEPITIYAVRGKKTQVLYAPSQAKRLIQSGKWTYKPPVKRVKVTPSKK